MDVGTSIPVGCPCPGVPGHLCGSWDFRGLYGHLPVQWQADFGGTQNDYLFNVVQGTDGNYLLAGTSFSGISGNKTNGNLGDGDFWIIKVNTNGVKVWERTFGGNSLDDLFAAQATADGGFILGGSSFSGISGNKTNANLGNSDFWLVKVSATGTKQWERVFGGTSADDLYNIQTTSDGGYILVGRTASGISGNKTNANFGSFDIWVIKTDANGNKQWEQELGGTAEDYAYSVLTTTDGGYLVGGTSQSGVSGNKTLPSFGAFGSHDYWIVKLEGNGNKQWEQVFGGTDYDEINVVLKTTDGGYVIAGSSASAAGGNKVQDNFGGYDFWLIKLNASGLTQWERVYGGVNDDEFLNTIQQTSDGGFMLLGTAWSGASGNRTNTSLGASDYWMVKVNSVGAKQWEQAFGGINEDYPWSLLVTSDGGYLLAGHSESGISGTKTVDNFGLLDNWIIKLEAEPYPRMSIEILAGNAIVSWASPSTGFILQQRPLAGGSWNTVPFPTFDDGTTKTVTVPLSPTDTLFRLIR